MFTERGRVVESKPDMKRAIVEISRSSACSACHAQCALKDSDQQAMRIEANDPLGVTPNQYVQFSMSDANGLKVSFVVYLLPVFALILGALLGQYLGPFWGIETGLAILGSFGFLGLSFFVIKQYNTHFMRNPDNLPVITAVVPSNSLV